MLICNVCNSKFRRPELFDQHCMNCVDLHDEQFTPSFLTVSNVSNNQVVSNDQVVRNFRYPFLNNQPQSSNHVFSDYESYLDNQSQVSQAVQQVDNDDNELNQQSVPDFENQVGRSLFIEIQDNPSLTEPNICKNPGTLNNTINKEDDKQKEKERKRIERKTQNLEEIIQSISLTSPMKYQIIHNVVKKNPKSLEQILEISNKEKHFEELVTECLITNLKQLNKEKNSSFPGDSSKYIWRTFRKTGVY